MIGHTAASSATSGCAAQAVCRVARRASRSAIVLSMSAMRAWSSRRTSVQGAFAPSCLAWMTSRIWARLRPSAWARPALHRPRAGRRDCAVAGRRRLRTPAGHQPAHRPALVVQCRPAPPRATQPSRTHSAKRDTGRAFACPHRHGAAAHQHHTVTGMHQVPSAPTMPRNHPKRRHPQRRSTTLDQPLATRRFRTRLLARCLGLAGKLAVCIAGEVRCLRDECG